jgi:GxxExxY protein
METKKNLIYADECYRIMGLIFQVFNDIGYGHKENFYQKALAKVFNTDNVPFREQLRCKLKYKGEDLGLYIFDFLVFDKIIIEIKQKNYLSYKDIQQVYKYLKAASLKLGLIVTFTSKGVKYKRIVNLD